MSRRPPRWLPRQPLAAALAVCLTVVLLVEAGAVPRAAGVPRASGVAARATVVAPLGAGAQGTRLVAGADDLYVIDAAAERVQRYLLHGLPYAELFTQVMRWKEGADKLIMGRPLDLYLDGSRLLILDSLGSLWSYQGATYQRALVPLRLQSNQGSVVALALHGHKLLLLDPATRRIWTYQPAATGGYDTVPASLTARPIPALADGIRLAAGRDALYVLLSHGGVLALPWARPQAVRHLSLPAGATGVWASARDAGCTVSFADGVALVGRDGRVGWRVSVAGLGAASIRDVALSPTGVLYVATATRILRLSARPPLSPRAS